MVIIIIKLNVLDKILVINILIGILGIINIYNFHTNYKDIVFELGEKEIKRKSLVLISELVNSEISLYSNENFFLDNDIQSKISFDSILLTKISNNIVKKINNDLFFRSNNLFEVPFGLINRNLLLNANGPNIPISFRYFGETKCELKCEVSNYAINSVVVKIMLDIYMNVNMMLPLFSENFPIFNSYPVVIELLQGEIPDIVFGNYPVINN